MNRLLLIAERELKKVQARHEEINGTDVLKIFLDWGRNGEQRLELLTKVDVSKHNIRDMCGK